jgi:hypothetical protein
MIDAAQRQNEQCRGNPMEVAELKTMIDELEARVAKIRDWL